MNRLIAIASLFAVLLIGRDATAEEPSKEQCADAYHAAQELRLDSKLIAARDKATFCAQDGCPDVLRSDCSNWVVELGKETPSLVIAASDPNGDVTDVRVLLDGELVTEALDGKPFAVDPGEHTLRFERAGEPEQEKTVMVTTGVKNREIRVRFGGDDLPPEDSGDSEDSTMPIAGGVLIGVGGAAVIVFAVLAGVGTSEVNDLRDTCGVNAQCDEADVDAAKTKIIAGDIALAGGVVAAGIGVVLLILHYAVDPADEEQALTIAPGPGGASAVLRF